MASSESPHAASATFGVFRVYLDPDPDPDGGPISWVVKDTRDDVFESDWFTFADACTEARRLNAKERHMADTITRDNLTELFPEDGPVGAWPQYRKRGATPMIPLEGPCTVATKEGEYELPTGWRGMLAIDVEGDPYPIAQETFEQSYEIAPPPEEIDRGE